MQSFLSKQKVFLVIFVSLAQLFLIGGIYLTNYLIIDDAQEIRLQLEPVDPRDIFRGDYVILNYKISNLKSVYFFEDQSKLKAGDNIYVNLYLSNSGTFGNRKIPEAFNSSISKTKPYQAEYSNSSGYRRIFIKGKIESATLVNNSSSLENDPIISNYNNNQYNLTIDYGINQLFIPEGTGRGVTFNNKTSYGIIKLGKDGQARVDRLEVDGKVWPE